MWRSRVSDRFESIYNRLSAEMVRRVDTAIIALLSSRRPELMGIAKKGSRKGYFAWELGRSCRILYRPDYDEMVIEFFRVCSHKEVYGP